MPPKGWRKDGKQAEKEVPEPTVKNVPAQPVATEIANRDLKPVVLTPVEESRKALLVPLEHGQAFFEAPDGFIIVADEKQDRVFYRAGNGGQGYWINRRRA